MNRPLVLFGLALSLAACQEAKSPDSLTFQPVATTLAFKAATISRTPEGYTPSRSVIDARARLTHTFVQNLKQANANPQALYVSYIKDVRQLSDPVATSLAEQAGAQLLLLNVAASLPASDVEQHVRVLVEAGSPNAEAVAAGLQRLNGVVPQAELQALATEASAHARTFLGKRCGTCAQTAGKSGRNLSGTTQGDRDDPATDLGDAQLQLAYDGIGALEQWSR